ncbi:MAG TPA: bile acid:sodium symporter [Polyangia bacterium]|nr:bile acid:sodium symporter [Polyangia bacterium]
MSGAAETRGSRFEALLNRWWLAAAIAAVVAVALLAPRGAGTILRWHVIDGGVVVVMFLGSLKLDAARFREAARQVRLVALSLVSVFTLAPLAALGLAWAFGLDGDGDRIAVLICAAQASTLATAIVLTEVAGGDVALAILITVVNNVATVAVTPLIFFVLGDTRVEVDHLAMAGEMALKILAPVLLAQLCRHWLAGFARRNGRRLSVFSQLVILIYIYTGVASSAERLADAGSLLVRVLALAAALHLLLLLANALIARSVTPSVGARTAFVLCSSQKTLPAAILVWKSHFPQLAAGPLVAVAYHMLQLVADSILAPGFRRLPLIRGRSVRDDEPPPGAGPHHRGGAR